MNDHRPPDDIERLVRASLDRRAATLGTPDGGLDGVWERVDHRRARRRRVAAVGSLAAVGVGAVAIATLGGARDAAPAADGPAPTDAAVTTTAVVPTTAVISAGSNVWRCVGQIDYFGEDPTDVDNYYADCVAVTLPVAARVYPMLPFPTTTTVTYAIGPDGSVEDPTTTQLIATSTTAPCDPTACSQSYTVVAGDSVAVIAAMYGIDAQVLANYNSWPEGIEHPIFVGDVIQIPPGAILPDGTRIGSIDDSTVPTTTSP